VDGNVRRVLSRLFDLPDPSPSQVRTLAAELVDPERPGDFNQALMELGATVCAPRSPECGVCPLADSCLALAAGTVEQRPLRKEKKKVPEVEVRVLVAVRMGGEGAASSGSGAARGSGEPPWQHRLLLRKRPQSGLLAGMWEFPGVEGDEEDAGLADGTLAVLPLAEELGLEPEAEPTELPMELPSVAHLFSHLKAHYHPVLVPVASMAEVDEGRWVTPEGLTELPLPVAQQRIARLALKALDPRQGGFS
jgi:A/G-specific adenine glycosylase